MKNPEMLQYKNGYEILSYDFKKYDFRDIISKQLSQMIEEENRYKLNKLENMHQIPNASLNLETYRQMIFKIFRGEKFQKVYKAFGLYVIDQYFNKEALIQKTPTIRIQFPGAKSTSYHCDGWYGHGQEVKSFWLPLVDVGSGSTLYISNDLNKTSTLMTKFSDEKTDLDDINLACRNFCDPFEGAYGNVLSFNSSAIHGTERNSRSYTRVSFDFRIAQNEYDLGTKPKSNFYTYDELFGDAEVKKETLSNDLRSIIYTNRCNGVSAKIQGQVCSDYCAENGINVIGGESEILPLYYLPVLRYYLSQREENSNCVVVYGLEIFQGDREIASSILDLCNETQKKLIFSMQNLVFDPAHPNKDGIMGKI